MQHLTPTKSALITGIAGQDGSYLAELLLEKGYEVHGIVRRSSSINTDRIDHIFKDIKLHYGDITDGSSIRAALYYRWPDEIYHLAAQSHVKVSFELPEYTANADALGTLNLLQAVHERQQNTAVLWPKIYNACTSEMFGSARAPQNESTPFMPCSPYGTAKLYSYWIARNYRESYGLQVSNGIMFNHESPRRGETFVTRKIVKGAVRLLRGQQESLKLGNIEAVRDWGHAKDYVRAMHLMLQEKKSDDYVIATGKQYSVRYLLEYVFKKLHNPLVWINKDTATTMGGKNIYVNQLAWERPNEVNELCGDASKAKKILGWTPTITFDEMIDEMIQFELENNPV